MKDILTCILFFQICISNYGFGACTRPIVVPASSLGTMSIVEPGNGRVSGIYPDLLREFGAREGCEFIFPIVPRARAELMIQTNHADLMIGAVQVPERGKWGYFVPLMNVEWMLVSNRPGKLPKSVQELVSMKNVRINVVRSFNAGPAYMSLITSLEKQGTLEYVDDPETIIRKMLVGRVDFTLMPSGTFSGAMDNLKVRSEFGDTLRYSHLEGIPVAATGFYISKSTASADVEQIKKIILKIRQQHILIDRLRLVLNEKELVSYHEIP